MPDFYPYTLNEPDHELDAVIRRIRSIVIANGWFHGHTKEDVTEWEKESEDA
jgi:hypothetical protein